MTIHLSSINEYGTAEFRVKLNRCKVCGKFMIIKQWPIVPPIGLGVQDDYNSDMCTECVKNYGYDVRCKICGETKKYPIDFMLLVTEYISYGSDESDHSYVCIRCYSDKPKNVLDLVILSNNHEIIDHHEPYNPPYRF